jgi:surface antigen
MQFKTKTIRGAGVAAVLASAVALGGCGETRLDGRDTAMLLGGAVGALAGGYVGAQFGGGFGNTLMMAAGATGGALVGAAAGPALFGEDLDLHLGTARTATQAASAEPQYWSNPDTGNEGMVRVTGAYTDAEGRPCRRYRATVTVDGRISSGDGAACLAGSGDWRVVSDRFG